jgi:hypothetical protein
VATVGEADGRAERSRLSRSVSSACGGGAVGRKRHSFGVGFLGVVVGSIRAGKSLHNGALSIGGLISAMLLQAACPYG